MKKGFSLIELLISLIIISTLIAAMAPILTKRTLNQRTALNASFSTSCSGISPECKLCKKGKCLICAKKCSNTQYLETESCSCKECSSLVTNCTSCTFKGCTNCNNGYGLNITGSTSCTQCTSGSYSTGNSACKACESGTYNQSNGQSSCADCPRGFKCQGGNDKTQCTGTTFSEAKSTACYNCPDGYICTGGTRNTCPIGYYCKGGVQKPCSDFGAGCTQCGVSGCTQKDCSIFGACTECTPTTCTASGCSNGSLNGTRCESCPNGYYCHNGAKINCSTFGTTCTNCNSTGCSSCSGGYSLTNGRCLAPIATPEIKCNEFDPYCIECDSTKCTKCKSGYLDGGKCIQNCEAFGPGCLKCNSSGCENCGTGYKQVIYKTIKYCSLSLTGAPVNRLNANHLAVYNLVPGLEFYNSTTDKCSSPYAPCCWKFNGDIDTTVVCNHAGAAAVCGSELLGAARLPDTKRLEDFTEYVNNHQDTRPGITGTGADSDRLHAVLIEGFVKPYNLCQDGTTNSYWCQRLNGRCCYGGTYSNIPCSCSAFSIWGNSYGTNLSIFSQVVQMGTFPSTAALRAACYK